MWERRGVKGGGGSHLCRAGAAAIAAHSPRALFGAGGSAGSKLASARSPGQQRGRPAAACTAASAALWGPERSEGESKSPGAEPGETQLREGARPAQPPPARERESPRRSPRGQESWEHRSPQPQGWSRSRREARYSAPCRGSPPPADLQGCEPGRPRPEKLVVRAPLSARSERAREAAKLRGHGLGEPLLLPGTAGPAVRAGAARGLPAPRVPDARLHQPLGSQNRRRVPGGQPHRQQVRLHQHRTGNGRLARPSALVPEAAQGRGSPLLHCASCPLLFSPPSPSSRCALAAVLTIERCSLSPSPSLTYIHLLPRVAGVCVLFTSFLLATRDR